MCKRTALDGRHPNTAGPVAVYLRLGGGLPKALQRLQQMAQTNKNGQQQQPWLFRILTRAVRNRDDWTEFLAEADAFFTKHRETLRLVVVDALADLVRDDFGLATNFDRTTWLLAWVQRCKVLADRYSLTWLLLNPQATTVSAAGVWENKPALGLAWAHAVQASWICHRGTPRRLTLHKSNRYGVRDKEAFFQIEAAGVTTVKKVDDDE